ncbi:hypothetical protein C8R46DRAFT_1205682 [Mycena filopes]|nr:hypothetical protein C8R46DRAFT_1205682 [Mycena filopes]
MNPNLVPDASGPHIQPPPLFDSAEQQYDPTAQPYDNSGQTYHPLGQPYQQYDAIAQPYDNSGQPFHAPNHPYQQYNPMAQPYDSSDAYDTSAQRYDVSGGQHLNSGGQQHNAAPQVDVPEEGWFDPASVDVAGLVASNQQLLQKISRAEQWSQQATDEFQEMKAQRDAAQKLMADTLARLERLELPQGAPTDQSPSVSRTKPASSKAKPTPATPAKKNKAGKGKATALPKTTPATPAKVSATPSHGRRTSGQPKQPPASTPRPKPSKPSPEPSHSSSQPSPAAAQSPPPASPANGTPGSATGTASASSSTGKKPRRVAEHQMFRDDISPQARTFKATLQIHCRFIGNNLVSGRAPTSASPEDVEHFNLRFNGLTVTELKRLGVTGKDMIKPSEVKVGIPVADGITSRKHIIRAFCQLEEFALLHIKSYFAKLGIRNWAIDYNQSAYSMYNMAMRMAAIDTFRYMVSGSFYDFLQPNTSYIHDNTLVVRVYDHFTHKYQFDLWKKEIRMPGGNELTAERNKYSKTRKRTYDGRWTYLKGAKVRKGLRLMFDPLATSDTDSDKKPNGGSVALAREERSEAADQIIRKVDSFIVQDLREDGKLAPANAREKRIVPAFGQRGPAHFKAIPKGMPIQYYSPSWFNDRPAHARAKIAPKLVVAFAPGTTDYFSRRVPDNKLTIAELTAKYGHEVFGEYDLDFEPEAENAEDDDDDEDGEGDADDEGEGDEVGSEDSEDEGNSSDAGSVADFLDDAGEKDDDMDEYSDADAEGEDDDDAVDDEDDAVDDEAAKNSAFLQAMDEDV